MGENQKYSADDASSTSDAKSGQVALEKAALTLDQYDPELVKKTWRKVDLHIMPVAVLLYLASYIDR